MRGNNCGGININTRLSALGCVLYLVQSGFDHCIVIDQYPARCCCITLYGGCTVQSQCVEPYFTWPLVSLRHRTVASAHIHVNRWPAGGKGFVAGKERQLSYNEYTPHIPTSRVCSCVDPLRVPRFTQTLVLKRGTFVLYFLLITFFN